MQLSKNRKSLLMVAVSNLPFKFYTEAQTWAHGVNIASQIIFTTHGCVIAETLAVVVYQAGA